MFFVDNKRVQNFQSHFSLISEDMYELIWMLIYLPLALIGLITNSIAIFKLNNLEDIPIRQLIKSCATCGAITLLPFMFYAVLLYTIADNTDIQVTYYSTVETG